MFLLFTYVWLEAYPSTWHCTSVAFSQHHDLAGHKHVHPPTHTRRGMTSLVNTSARIACPSHLAPHCQGMTSLVNTSERIACPSHLAPHCQGMTSLVNTSARIAFSSHLASHCQTIHLCILLCKKERARLQCLCCLL